MADSGQNEKKMYRLTKGEHRGVYEGKTVHLVAGTKKDTGMFRPSFVRKFPGRFAEVEEKETEQEEAGAGIASASAESDRSTSNVTIDLALSEAKLLPLIANVSNPALLNALFDEEEAGKKRPKVMKALQEKYAAIKPAKAQAQGTQAETHEAEE